MRARPAISLPLARLGAACFLLAVTGAEAGWFGGKGKSGNAAESGGGFTHTGRSRGLGISAFSLSLQGTILDGTMVLKLEGDVQTHIANGCDDVNVSGSACERDGSDERSSRTHDLLMMEPCWHVISPHAGRLSVDMLFCLAYDCPMTRGEQDVRLYGKTCRRWTGNCVQGTV